MILCIVGTRPELLKTAPVVKACRDLGLQVHVHCTLQSPDLLDQTILRWDSFGPLEAAPHADLAFVWGDTRTCLQGAIWAHEHSIPLMHGEGGVRSGDLSSPHPEEGFRKAISALATFHVCTTQQNHLNLSNERLTKFILDRSASPAALFPNARVTGSPIVQSVRERSVARNSQFIFWIGTGVPPLKVIVTLHRRENRGHFKDIWNGIGAGLGLLPGSAESQVNTLREVTVLWPCHPNGWAEEEAPQWAKDCRHSPMNAVDFAHALRQADLLITDSGGCVEEASSLGVRSVQARSVTDRPECLGKGGSVLGGITTESVAQAIQEALQLDREAIDRSIYGDESASSQIATWIAELVG